MLTHELGSRFEIMEASIKKWCVGSPIQSVLDATTALVAEHRIRPDDVKRDAHHHAGRPHAHRRQPLDAGCLRAASRDARDRSTAPSPSRPRTTTRAWATRPCRRCAASITLIPSPELTKAEPARQAIVEIDLAGGKTVRHHAKAVRGTPDNPMTTQEIEDKARDLVAPITGAERAGKLVEAVRAMETMRSVRELRPLLQA